MKQLIAAVALAYAGAVFAQCQPIGWVLVEQKSISITERLCVYQKSGVKLSIIVSGFCPMSPC